MQLTIEVYDDDLEHLYRLVGVGIEYPCGTVEELATYLLHHAADGVRRPGSWERGWIQQATGVEL